MTVDDGSGVQVRKVEVHEAGRYRDIRLRALADSPGAFATRYEDAARRTPEEWVALVAKLSAEPGCGFWIAEAADGRWVALAGTYRPEHEPGMLELMQVWTDPVARRTGLGRRVIEALLEHGRPHAPAGFGHWVADGNDGAVRFYEALGFTVATTTAVPFAQCDIWMEKRP